MGRPLQVYLDSSDFSNLSDPAKRTPALEDVERSLLEWQQAGKIDLRFSYAHVVEAAPVRREDLKLAKGRLIHIQRLCGRRCLVDPFSLLEHEIRRAAFQAQLSNEFVYRDDGQWTPPIDAKALDIPSPAKILREEIDSMCVNRKQRRAAEGQFFDKSGRLRPSALAHLRKQAPSVLIEMEKQYPMTPAALAEFGSYMAGTGSPGKALQGLKDSFADLERFAKWHETHWDKVTKTTLWLREVGADVKASFQKSADEFRSLYESHEALGVVSSEIERTARDSFLSALTRMPESLAGKLAVTLNVSLVPSRLECSWRMTPALMTIVFVIAHMNRLTALVPKAQRKPRTSDFGDVIHTLYLPFVDIFRADGFAAKAISDAKLECLTTVVSNLTQLPGAIECRLKQRGASLHSGMS